MAMMILFQGHLHILTTNKYGSLAQYADRHYILEVHFHLHNTLATFTGRQLPPLMLLAMTDQKFNYPEESVTCVCMGNLVRAHIKYK